MAIKYGTLTEGLPALPCGYVVPDDIEKLKKAGSLLWQAISETSDPTEVIVWDASKTEPEGYIPLALERTGVTDEVKELVREIHNEVCTSPVSHSILHPSLKLIDRILLVRNLARPCTYPSRPSDVPRWI